MVHQCRWLVRDLGSESRLVRIMSSTAGTPRSRKCPRMGEATGSFVDSAAVRSTPRAVRRKRLTAVRRRSPTAA